MRRQPHCSLSYATGSRASTECRCRTETDAECKALGYIADRRSLWNEAEVRRVVSGLSMNGGVNYTYEGAALGYILSTEYSDRNISKHTTEPQSHGYNSDSNYTAWFSLLLPVGKINLSHDGGHLTAEPFII